MLASDTEKPKLPPGPAEAFDLHTTEESFARVAELITDYGDICQISSPTRRSTSYLINHPDYIKHVLVKNNANYTKGVGFERVKLLLGNGIIVSDGPFWRRQRRMIQPAFDRRLIAALMHEMVQCNLVLRDAWREKAGTGEIINITETASELALRIVLRSIFGDDLEQMEAEGGGNPFAILTDDSARDMQLVMKYRALRKLVQATIARRRQGSQEHEDFLAAFMQGRDKDTGEAMTDRELIDEVMTLIVAGHETSACTLNWVWYLLSLHPEAEAEVQKEADQIADVENPDFMQITGMSFSRQVVEEALRLYPPVWLFTRKTLEDDRLGDYFVPAGTDIFIAPYFLHRHPEFWQDVEQFKPERFTEDAVKARHKQAFIPFSAGPRRCIGDFFATVEMQVHLAILAREFHLEYVPDKPIELSPNVNLRSKHSILMRVRSR